METPSPTPPETAAPPPDAKGGLPAPVWVAGVIVLLGLTMWFFQR